MRAIFLSLLVMAVLYAQSNQGSISGIVTDQQGAAVPSAKIAGVNTATQIRTETVSNASGFYTLPNLPVGQYTLQIEAGGFRRAVTQAVTLSTGQAMELNVKLEIGQVTETINVTTEAPLVETRSSDVTQLVDSKSIES